jgi:predicted transposase/invertase (TIGR01784 family)
MMNDLIYDPAMLRAYEQYEKAASDYTSGINDARREGWRGGEQNKAMDIARKMKSKGKAINEIADDTGLSVEEVMRL